MTIPAITLRGATGNLHRRVADILRLAPTAHAGQPSRQTVYGNLYRLVGETRMEALFNSITDPASAPQAALFAALGLFVDYRMSPQAASAAEVVLSACQSREVAVFSSALSGVNGTLVDSRAGHGRATSAELVSTRTLRDLMYSYRNAIVAGLRSATRVDDLPLFSKLAITAWPAHDQLGDAVLALDPSKLFSATDLHGYLTKLALLVNNELGVRLEG